MKKLFCLLLALLTIGGCALAETENKTDEAVLNVFTWEGYIDYSTVIKPFEEETGTGSDSHGSSVRPAALPAPRHGPGCHSPRR